MKIVSLVPSIAEAACMLGLEDSLVGITDYCLHGADCCGHRGVYAHEASELAGADVRGVQVAAERLTNISRRMRAVRYTRPRATWQA